MHLEDAAHTLAMALRGVINRAAGVNRAGVHAEERQTAHIGVGRNLERECRERRAVIGRALVLLVGVGVDALNRRDIGGRGHIIDNRVKQHLHALVAVRGAAEDRDNLYIDNALAQRGLHLVNGDFFAFEVLHGEVLVKLGNRFDHGVMIFLRLLQHILGDFLLADILAEVIIINLRFHTDEVDDAAEGLLRANRQLDRDGVAFQAVLHHIHNVEEVCAHDIHLIDERHARDVVLVSLMPDGFGLRLDAALCAKDGYRAVQHAQRAFDLNGKVNVARGVDDVDTMSLPMAGRRGGSDGNAAFLFLLHPVHGGGAVMGVANLVIDAGIEQDAFGGSGFTGINVRHDADVSGFFKSKLSGHIALLSKLGAALRGCGK